MPESQQPGYFNTNPIHVLMAQHMPDMGLSEATWYEALSPVGPDPRSPQAPKIANVRLQKICVHACVHAYRCTHAHGFMFHICMYQCAYGATAFFNSELAAVGYSVGLHKSQAGKAYLQAEDPGMDARQGPTAVLRRLAD